MVPPPRPAPPRSTSRRRSTRPSQAGINAAQPGDTVLIADGTYTGVGNINLDFGGKAITVTSQHGAARTIIDLQSLGRAVFFHSGETAAARLQGLTIEHGLLEGKADGAGIYINGSSPTIAGCVLAQNLSNHYGGGLAASDTSTPTVTGCTFTGNGALQYGGGLFLAGSGTVTGCTFTENISSYNGGGLSINRTIAGNAVGAVVSSCTFSGNTALPLAGGGNGGGNGGGISVGTQAPGGFSVILNCVFVGNKATTSGGGIYGDFTVTNCSFYGNIAPVGAGVSLGAGLSVISALTNCILWDGGGSDIDTQGSPLPVTYCDLLSLQAGAGNVSLDPQFVRFPALGATPPLLPDYGDLRLRAASALVHIGTGVGAPATDAGGAVRPATPSIGAYETAAVLLPDTADAYVLSSAPAQNFGAAPALSVGGFLGAAYLRFDLSSLKTLAATSTVKLHLNAGMAQAGAASLAVAATGTGWTETGLTFSRRPALGQPLGFLNVTADGAATAPYDVDITAYVQAQQAAEAAQIGLALTQYKLGLPVSIDSKENLANDGPQLIVTY